MDHLLIAISFLTIAVVLFLTACRTPQLRSVTLGAGALMLFVGSHAIWLAWSARQTVPPDHSGERLITIHGFVQSPAATQGVAGEAETPEAIVVRMGCGVCHQIPGMEAARSGQEGPLLIAAVTAPRRLASKAYQRSVGQGRATAQSPREYVRESILNPSAFVVPGFEQRTAPAESAMPSHFGAIFTVAALDTLVDYLLTQNCQDAVRGGLTGPRVESIELLCGDRSE